MCPAPESPDGLSFWRGMWFREQSIDWISTATYGLGQIGSCHPAADVQIAQHLAQDFLPSGLP